MNFLPIVTRELRAASRRKGTYRIRQWSAAAICGFSCFFLLAFAFGTSSRALGAEMFSVLSYCALVFALLGGIFLAADCLSQERREETLGFLFLTDLKGYDIVLGKFAAVSLNAFYGLIATFPVLGLCLLAGGVEGEEFWRTCVALINLLFFSIAAAIWVSSRSRITSRSLVNSFAIVVAMVVLSALARGLISMRGTLAEFLQDASLISPITAFTSAKAAAYLYGAKFYWRSLLISNLAGWTLLGLASWRLKYFRQSSRRSVFTFDLFTFWRKRRRQNLEIDPVVWMLDDSPALRWAAWVIATLGAAVAIVVAICLSDAGIFFGMFGSPFNFVLKFLFTVQACRFFSEARQSGALELLFSTPLSLRGMVQGQWRVLSRIFLWPAIFLVLVEVSCLVIEGRTETEMFGAASFVAGKLVLTNAADFYALGWFGMWSALTFRKPTLAAGFTALYLLVLPSILYCAPSVVIDVVLGVIAYSKLKLLCNGKDPSRYLLASQANVRGPALTGVSPPLFHKGFP